MKMVERPARVERPDTYPARNFADCGETATIYLGASRRGRFSVEL
jgi:hypothetical protein